MNKKIIFFDVDGTLVDVRPAREYVLQENMYQNQQSKQ